jgi:hypothetical protein
VGAGGTDNQVDRAVHPTDTPNPSRSSGETQPATGLLTTGATSSPYSATVPGQCRWRLEGRWNLIRATARAASTPTVAMATTPPPAPTRGPTSHEGVSNTPSLSLSLSQAQTRSSNLDLTYAVAIVSTTMVSEPLIYSRRLASGLRTQKRERETLTLEKRSAKRGGLTFFLRVLGVVGTPIQSRVDFHWQPRQERREGFDPGHRRGFSSLRHARDPRRPLGLQGARGGPGAALGWAAGAGAAGHVAAPELPWAG